jgi:uncharacterized damage-inducible protein DinB
MSESTRIADQLRRAFEGEAWHGDSLFQILDGVTAAQAASRPVKQAHSIWELVLHIAAWDGACSWYMKGEAVDLPDEQNFPAVKDTSDTAWRKTLKHAKDVHDDLVQAVAAFPDSRLNEKVPGKGAEPAYYNFYYLLHGVVQHELYHAGQIALLKKMV